MGLFRKKTSIEENDPVLLTLDKLAEIVVEQMIAAIGISGCSISWWNKRENFVETLVTKTTNGHFLPSEARFDLEDYPATRSALENSDTVLIKKDDLQADPAEVARLNETGFITLMMLPMVIAEEVVGLVNLYDDHDREFSDSELNVIKILSSQAAITIQTIKQSSTLQEELFEERTLRDAAIIFSKTLDRNRVLSLLAEKFVNTIDVTSVYICSYDPKTKISTVLSSFFGKNATKKEKISDVGESYQYDDGFDEMQNDGIDQYHADDPKITEKERQNLQEYGCQSVLLIKLKLFGEINGLIEVWESRRQRVFTQKEIKLCVAISRQASIAIENTLLFEEAQKEISHRKEIEKELEYQAFYDTLTNLPNRFLFMERLEHSIRHQKRNPKRSFAILFLDIDKLKLVNDSLGHAAGDELLKFVSKTLLRCVREIDTVSRFGGDEFLILLEETNHNKLIKVVKRIQNEIGKPINLMGQDIVISTSIGIIGSNNDQQSSDDLIKKADLAMFHAKSKRGGRFEFYDPSLGEVADRRLILETELRNAVKTHQIGIHYQPLVALTSNGIIGFEALARWESKTLGAIPPIEFIPIAEELGLIVELGFWILRVSCEQILEWQKSYKPKTHFSVSINVSPSQLHELDFASKVRLIIQDVGIDPRSVVLEITESMLLDESETVIDNIYGLVHEGIRIHIDDFGTGYSSLSNLGRFPIDALKIDRVFISKFDQDRRTRSMVATIISMANDNNMQIVAEGIEQWETAGQLEKMGCQYGQGYGFSKGKSPEEMIEFLDSRFGL